MIKAIIFDLGGVVFRDGTRYALLEMKERFNFSETLCLELLHGKDAKNFRKGLMNPDDFWKYVQSKIPPHIKASEIRSLWYDNYIPSIGIFELLNELEPKFKLGIISGNIKERVEYLDQKYAFRKYFTSDVYSFDLHTTKPDKIMWKKALELLNLDAAECVYLDDNPESVYTAKSLGFEAVLFRDVVQVRRELARLGII
jgi:putative hydrolase of the HAD superfamily